MPRLDFHFHSVFLHPRLGVGQWACARVWDWGTSLVAQWLRVCTSNAGGTGLILGQGTKSQYAMWCSQKIKKKKKKKGCEIGSLVSVEWSLSSILPSCALLIFQSVICCFLLNKFKKYLFIFIFDYTGSSFLYMGFLWLWWEGLLSQSVGFWLWWLLSLQSTGSRRMGFNSCGSWA